MTKIEWTDKTLNPGLRGCSKVSPACRICYAEIMHDRLVRMGVYPPESQWGSVIVLPLGQIEDRFATLPKKVPKRVFVTSMSDLFHRGVPFAWIGEVFRCMAERPHHSFQVLTKRADRMAAFADWLRSNGRSWPDNVWAGVTVENQECADRRIPHLLRVPALVRFLSCEPLLGWIDLTQIRNWHAHWNTVDVLRFGTWDTGHFSSHSDMFLECGPAPIRWVIVGGESGAGAVPMHPAWVRSLRDQCAGIEAGGRKFKPRPEDRGRTPFFFKQWGAWGPLGPVYPGDDEGEVDVEVESWPTHVALEPSGIQAQGSTRGTDWCDHQPGEGSWWMALTRKGANGRVLDGHVHEAFPAGSCEGSAERRLRTG